MQQKQQKPEEQNSKNRKKKYIYIYIYTTKQEIKTKNSKICSNCKELKEILNTNLSQTCEQKQNQLKQI
jgi:hypothetical protein